MLDLLFSRSQPVLQSETGSETLPDNPALPVPQDLITPVFAKTLISKKNTDFGVCVRSRAEGETAGEKASGNKNKGRKSRGVGGGERRQWRGHSDKYE